MQCLILRTLVVEFLIHITSDQTFDVLKDSLHIRGELLRATEEVAGVAV